MNRFSKGFRTFGGICILLNLAAFFLPVTERVQKNYATLQCSEWDYLLSLLKQQIPTGADAASASVAQLVWIVLLMLLPLLLSLIAGIWGIVGGHRQIVSSLLAFVVLTLYIGMCISISYVWPVAGSGQTYCRGYAYLVHLAASGGAVLVAILSLISTPREIRMADAKAANIPQVQEIRQQQVEARYNIIMEEAKKAPPEPKTEVKPYVPGSEPRGVMVFLNGIYAGAEIPFNGSDFILLGRSANNHLIFEGQPRISRNHCKIRWDAQRKKFVFLDYSSTGSFVNGSTDCLPQNLELDMEPGTVVAIGDESNSFRLE